MTSLPLRPYAQRSDRPSEASLGLARWLAHRAGRVLQRVLGAVTPGRRLRALQAQAHEIATALAGDAPGTAFDPQALQALRLTLRRDGLGAAQRVPALTMVARAGRATLRRTPYETQLLAALVMLDGDLAEMSTGEGKTYAAALGAAAWALSGMPVHLMTANDYLVQRDAQEMGPMFAALGLSVGCVTAASTPEQRRAAYACDVTYCTAREVAFDHLRDLRRGVAFRSEWQQRLDELAPGAAEAPAAAAAATAEPPLLRGLWAAVVDEADSLLVDEAALPLLLSEVVDPRGSGAQAAAHQRALAYQSLTLARQLRRGEHFRLDAGSGRVDWTPAGHARVEALAQPLSGVWFNRRHRADLLASALHALHGLQADRDYVVRDGSVQLLDPVTGRPAEGRQWSRGLHALVEMKEGCRLSPPTRVAARLSLQRFFGRYLRLAGMSGTLRECAGELRAAYGCGVVPVPRRLPSRLAHLPLRLFATEAQRVHAMVRRVRQLHARGRPVLVATSSVQASQAMSQALERAGIVHARLDARHDAQEAQVVARAGQRGAVTVATHMAGRGTDIALGPGVARLGGLHVLCCQDNPSARLDRQVVGRSGRRGEPGVAEVWRVLEASAWKPGSGWAGWVDRLVIARWQRRFEVRPPAAAAGPARGAPRSRRALQPGPLEARWFAWRQAREEAQQARVREASVEQDLQWQHRSGRALAASWLPALPGLFGGALAAALALGPQGVGVAQAQAPAPAAAPKPPPTVLQGTLPGAREARQPARPTAPTIGCLISPNRVADIGSPVTGIVERIPVDVGDMVRQGQTLVTLRAEVESAGERAAHTRWTADAEVRAAEASLELARQRYNRAAELQTQGFFSPQAVEQALTEQRLAEQKLAQTRSQRQVLASDLEVVRAQVNQRVVRAPFNGTIVERFRQPGERVEDRPLLRLASLDPLRVDLIVPAARFGQYAVGDRLAVQPDLVGVTPVLGEVTHVDRVIDGASNTYRVRLSLPNPDQRLPAGARCTVDDARGAEREAARRPGTGNAPAAPAAAPPATPSPARAVQPAPGSPVTPAAPVPAPGSRVAPPGRIAQLAPVG